MCVYKSTKGVVDLYEIYNRVVHTLIFYLSLYYFFNQWATITSIKQREYDFCCQIIF